MRLPRQFAAAALTAAIAIGILVVVLWSENRETRRRWATQVAQHPAAGSALFQAKGCAACHGASAGGTDAAPALRGRPSLDSVSRLVTAMWNHAPRMWDAYQAKKLPFPTLSYEEAGQLISYLYVSGLADNGGDAARGRELFTTKGCVRCHASGAAAARVVRTQDSDPLAWTQALWNHAAGMRLRMKQAGIAWPRFDPADVRDLFAYVRHEGGAGDELAVPAGDPENGWRIFQDKGCMRCHDVGPNASNTAHSFGPEHKLPPTFSEFASALLNHVPDMQLALRTRGLQWPTFAGSEMTDVTVFLYSLHYLEPSGSPQVGRSTFTWRGCNRCHGDDALGTRTAPGLRGRGSVYTATRLATDLWGHGAEMYRSQLAAGQPWPTLQDQDIGNLLAFLNTPPDR